MIITNNWLIKYRTPGGGYTKKQFQILGLQYPPQKGWKEMVIGKELPTEKAKEFEMISTGDISMSNQQSIFQYMNMNESSLAMNRSENKCIHISDIEKYHIDYFVYTDGSCVNNGSENAIAGIGIYFGENDQRNVSKRVIDKQSNNTAELQAIIDVYDIIKNDIHTQKICVVSDSTYAVHCITSYGEKQSKESWKKDIPNKDLVKKGYELYKDVNNIYFMYVKAHTEGSDKFSIGNACADRLANQAIGLTEYPCKSELTKIYLNVPFSQKENVKKLGGKWDSERKKWYIFDNNPQKENIIDIFQEVNKDI
jgi:ribonuclease HI